MTKVKFATGKKSSYDSIDKEGVLFLSNDSHEIIKDDIIYGAEPAFVKFPTNHSAILKDSDSSAYGDYSIVGGKNNSCNSYFSIVSGYKNTSSGKCNLIIGYHNNTNGGNTSILGMYNELLNGDSNIISGILNKILSVCSIVTGNASRTLLVIGQYRKPSTTIRLNYEIVSDLKDIPCEIVYNPNIASVEPVRYKITKLDLPDNEHGQSIISVTATLDRPLEHEFYEGSPNCYKEGNYLVCLRYSIVPQRIINVDNSVCIGQSTICSAPNTYAEGYCTLAAGASSHVEGSFTKAYGRYSHAQNLGTITTNQGETAVGQYNISKNNFNAANWNKFKPNPKVEDTDTIFTVGIGYNINNRRNALEIYRDGTIKIYDKNTDQMVDISTILLNLNKS